MIGRRCLFCGGNADEPGHLARCDGRQGAAEARAGVVFDRAEGRRRRDRAVGEVEAHADDGFMDRASLAMSKPGTPATRRASAIASPTFVRSGTTPAQIGSA